MFKFLCLFFFYTGMLTSVFSESKPVVNILTWWGYFDHPGVVEMIEAACDVEVSYDEYSSNDEFLRRLAADGEIYDIVIFSNTIYQLAKKYLKNTNTALRDVIDNYHPVVKDQYLKNSYLPNVVYLAHSIPVFMWNPHLLNIFKDEDLKSIFRKAKTNKILLFNDELELAELLSYSLGLAVGKTSSSSFTVENFNELVHQAKVYITNDPNIIAEDKDFAFMYTWSGDAFMHMRKSNREYPVIVHPKLAYISTELLGVLNKKDSTRRLAEYFFSEEYLNVLQNHSCFISPKFDTHNIENSQLKALYDDVVRNLSKMRWLESAHPKEFSQLQQNMKWIKLELKKNE